MERQRQIEERKEEEYDGPLLFDFGKSESLSQNRQESLEQQISLEPMSEITDSCKHQESTETADELPDFEDTPKRIVLPTSDEAPQNTPERAWQLLKAGEAEEAFMMFSKLLKEVTVERLR
ncbi:MAG: hypothetical protein HGA95_03385 [Caldiserica bacterium]|nr:hypothetical protein [Caldisericota bacterium]